MLSKLIWLGLPQTTRQALRAYLNIPKSGGTEVVDGRVVSDGTTDLDLATVTLGKLQEIFSDPEETDFYKLFNKLVKNVEIPPIEIPPMVETVTQTPIPETPVVESATLYPVGNERFFPKNLQPIKIKRPYNKKSK